MTFAYSPGSPAKLGRLTRIAAVGAFVLTVVTAIALGLSATAVARTSSPKCTIHGTPGRDLLHGTHGPDVICGAGGADRIYGGAGNDVILGGAGSDHLSGGPGRDIEKGGRGNDVCIGSSEQDDQITCHITRMTAAQAGSDPAGSAPASPVVEPPAPILWHGCTLTTNFCLPPVPKSPPVLHSAALSPETIDTSLGDSEATVDLTVEDEEAIVSGSVVVEGPDGVRQTIAVPSTPGLGSYATTVFRIFTFELPFHVSGSTPPGRYQLIEVSLRDPSGYEATFDHEALERVDENLWARPYLQTYRGPDITPPVLKGLFLPRGTVDTGTGVVAFIWDAQAADDQSGVAYMSYVIGSPPGQAKELWLS